MRRFAMIPQHTHRCDCQRAELTCYEPADQCEIRVWRCPKCEDDQLEADIHHMEALESTRTIPVRHGDSVRDVPFTITSTRTDKEPN